MTAKHRHALLIAMTLVVAACSEGDIAMTKSFVQQWALDHPVQIATAKAGFGSGDNLVDAAVGGYESVKSIHEADDLIAEGRAKQDPTKMDEALKLRPNDWTYQLSRANLALQLGDMPTVTKYWYPSLEANPGSVDAIAAYNRQQYSELALVHQRLNRGAGSVTGYRSYGQCTALYDRLGALSGKGVQDPAVTNTAADWVSLRKACEQLPH